MRPLEVCPENYELCIKEDDTCSIIQFRWACHYLEFKTFKCESKSQNERFYGQTVQSDDHVHGRWSTRVKSPQSQIKPQQFIFTPSEFFWLCLHWIFHHRSSSPFMSKLKCCSEYSSKHPESRGHAPNRPERRESANLCALCTCSVTHTRAPW